MPRTWMHSCYGDPSALLRHRKSKHGYNPNEKGQTRQETRRQRRVAPYSSPSTSSTSGSGGSSSPLDPSLDVSGPPTLEIPCALDQTAPLSRVPSSSVDNRNTFVAYSTELIPEHSQVNDPQVVAPSVHTQESLSPHSTEAEYTQLSTTPVVIRANPGSGKVTLDLRPSCCSSPRDEWDHKRTIQRFYLAIISLRWSKSFLSVRTDKKLLLHLTSPPLYHSHSTTSGSGGSSSLLDPSLDVSGPPTPEIPCVLDQTVPLSPVASSSVDYNDFTWPSYHPHRPESPAPSHIAPTLPFPIYTPAPTMTSLFLNGVDLPAFDDIFGYPTDAASFYSFYSY